MTSERVHPATTVDLRYSEPEAAAADWGETLQVIAAAQLFWLATVRVDGRPHVTPVHTVWLDHALHFCTGEGSQKARNLRSNTQVTLTTGCNHWDRGADVVLEGHAAPVRDPAQLRRLAAAWRERWDGRWQFQVTGGHFVHPADDVCVPARDFRCRRQR